MLRDDQDTIRKEGEASDDPMPAAVSRRKFVTMLGAAGAALAAGSLYGAGATPAEASENEKCAPMTIDELRLLTSPTANYIYYVTDSGREGIFTYDAADTTSVDNGGTVIRTGGLGTATGKCYKRVRNKKIVDVKWFGAKGDGSTNDSPAIQAAIGALFEKQTLLIPPGEYLIKSNITIGGSYKTITGGGTIISDATSASKGRLVFVGAVSFMIIDDIKFKSTSPVRTADTAGIELQDAKYIEIRNCEFHNMDKAIYVRPIDPPTTDAFQQAKRIKIHENLFEGVNYALHGIRDVTKAYTFLLADTHFENNQASCEIRHIDAEGVDGLVCSGNTMFFPGYTSDPTKQNDTKINNIRIKYCDWIVIQGNNIFEAGEDAIVLEQFADANISCNNIAYPGQRKMGSGIKLTGGGISGNLCMSVVSGNTILLPTLHGISVEGTCRDITITGNQIRFAGFDGTGTRYYGSPALNTVSHYGIYTANTTNFINITGNLASENINELLGTDVKYADNLSKNGDYSSKTRNFVDVATHASPALRFTSGWQNLGSGNATCQYYKDNYNVIHLKGVVYRSASSTNTTIFTLQQFYYSTTEKFIFTVPTQSGYGTVEVRMDGMVVFTGGDPTGYVSLCGISFRLP